MILYIVTLLDVIHSSIVDMIIGYQRRNGIHVQSYIVSIDDCTWCIHVDVDMFNHICEMYDYTCTIRIVCHIYD
jgi:hypothetical protein